MYELCSGSVKMNIPCQSQYFLIIDDYIANGELVFLTRCLRDGSTDICDKYSTGKTRASAVGAAPRDSRSAVVSCLESAVLSTHDQLATAPPPTTTSRLSARLAPAADVLPRPSPRSYGGVYARDSHPL